MHALIRSCETVSRFFGYVAAALVLVLMTLMAVEVVMRYVFAAPTTWSYDVTTMTMGAMFVLSIAYTLATDSHVRVDILHPLLPARARPLVDLIGFGLVMLPLTAWLSWALWEHFYERVPDAGADRRLRLEPAGVAVPRGDVPGRGRVDGAAGGRDGEGGAGARRPALRTGLTRCPRCGCFRR